MIGEIDQLIRILTSGDDQSAEDSSLKLASFGPEAIPALKKSLESVDIDHRWWAIRTIAQMDSPPMELLLNSLKDRSQEIKQCAALAISHHPDTRAIPNLLILLKDSDSLTCNLAATALISIGKDAIGDILEQYKGLTGVSRIEATRALACIQDERAIPVLLSALEEDSLAVNYWAEEGLNRLGLGMVYFNPD